MTNGGLKWRTAHGTTDGPAVQRLGQYEDTGLTPEEIKALEDFKNSKDDRCQTFNPD